MMTEFSFVFMSSLAENLFCANSPAYSKSLSLAETQPTIPIDFAPCWCAAWMSFFASTSTTASWNSYAMSQISCSSNGVPSFSKLLNK